jgi:hypothetical protein
MTQVSGVGAASPYDRLPQISGAGRPPREGGGRPPINPEEMAAKWKAAAAEQGVDTDKLDDLQETIQKTLHETLQNGGSFDDVKSAIDGVLKDNGIDPQKLQEQLGAAGGGFGKPTGGGGNAGFDFGGSLGSSSLLGVDLMKLLDGETKGLSLDQQA